MCGIVGYIGEKDATPLLLEGLSRLEYRGYDSAGVALFNQDSLVVMKAKGRLSTLMEKVRIEPVFSRVGIGHTRWPTHGKPSDENAHPHTDCLGQIVVVHNGIIENYLALKEELEGRGHTFKSETDTEVIAHLIEEYYEDDMESAFRRALKRLCGSYAIAALCKAEPEKLFAARYQSPLIIGVGKGENFLASDIPAVMSHTRDIHILEDGEVSIITRSDVVVSNLEGAKIDKELFRVQWDAARAEKGGYDHFMLKEIHEQPKAVKDTLGGRVVPESGEVVLSEVKISDEDIAKIKRIYIVACGTAYHAGIVGKHAIEAISGIPVDIDLASEFRYRNPMVDSDMLTIIISQSGETADTLAALREARARGSRVVGITNVVGSSVARESDDVIYTWAGPEIAVASTKAYITQLTALYVLAIYLARKRGMIQRERSRELLSELVKLPDKIQRILNESAEDIAGYAERFKDTYSAFFIGRGLDYAVSMEGSLKLKEISYIHAEAYAAGELKHGTLALIVEGVPVFALATQRALFEKMLSNIKEVKARDATVIAVAGEDNAEIGKEADHVIRIPETMDIFAPILSVVPLQLFAYYAAVARGCDVDKPRNLAKSVTVE